MAGRRPNIVHDNKKEKMTKAELEAIEKSTPLFESQNFIAPDTLTPREKKIWTDTTEMLKQMYGCKVSDADCMLIETLCQAKVEYDDACKRWAKNPRMYVQVETGGFDKDGLPKTALKHNPDYVIKRDFAKILIRCYAELGLTPLGRAKQGVAGGKSKEDNARDDFLSLMNRSDD